MTNKSIITSCGILVVLLLILLIGSRVYRYKGGETNSRKTLNRYPPESRTDLLSSKDPLLLVSSSLGENYGPEQLRDEDDSTYWHIAAEKAGAPAWVLIDFGEGQAEVINALALRPRADTAKQFLKTAELQGSNDQNSWEPVSSIIQEECPSDASWLLWEFYNPQAWRYYRLYITEGHEQGLRYRFYSLADLELYR